MQRSILAGPGAGEAPPAQARPAATATPPIRLLGERRLGSGAGEATLQYRKGWALLAYLALERQRHPRARLAAMLWPRLGETAALTNLRQVLSDLNRAMASAIGDGVLQIDRESVRLCPARSPGLFDVDRLDACVAGNGPGEAQAWLAEAGELLEGMTLDACESFAEWLAGARAWTAHRLADGLAVLRDTASARGARGEALVLARRLVAQDPWNEVHYRALMRLHAQAGEPGMALACYRSLVDRLKADLGEAPSRETAELAEAIRTMVRHAPAAAWWSGRARPPRRTLALALGA
ncbi:MAG TPA: BTAD domain-containing putative transcriptional regulator [Pseudoxanthomonas sp.]|nr:BTAD domain-containing putative transcriptional regulator [Pseudoxanthomonas sp.]